MHEPAASATLAPKFFISQGELRAVGSAARVGVRHPGWAEQDRPSAVSQPASQGQGSAFESHHLGSPVPHLPGNAQLTPETQKHSQAQKGP